MELDKRIVYINLILWIFSVLLLILGIKFGFIFVLFPFIFWFKTKE